LVRPSSAGNVSRRTIRGVPTHTVQLTARRTSASQVPLSSTTVPQAEFDFTAACEAWARSFDLDIFNDLLQPFQTHPPIPVHQATIQQPVHQARQPVHQAQQPVHQARQPVHQAPLQDFPALEGPQQTLRIEPPVTDDLDIVLRDVTPVVQPTALEIINYCRSRTPAAPSSTR
jgi:hypothetical protein